MSEVVCQVSNESSQVEFIWSSRGGFFRPYVVSGTQLTELRQAANQTRDALEKLVFTLNDAGAGPTPWEPSYALAEAGARLYNDLLPSEDATARKVRRWLEDLRKQSGLIGLEIVVEERSADAGTLLSVPWNLVYDELPEDYEEDFQAGEGEERWRPFWAIRYNLTTGRRVEPWKRLPVWSEPRVIVVIDPTVYETLHEDQKRQLDEFLAEARLTRAGSLKELKAALRAGYPRLLYWLGHATPEFLRLGSAEPIYPSDLRNLLRSYDDRERPEGMLAFLNACRTAESGASGSFLDVLHTFGFTGAIATERQTIDNFANEFGLAFLRGFLREGKPLGELLHSLRLERAPLGLLYGAHCPPEIRVRRAGDVTSPALPAIRESGRVAGTALEAAALATAPHHTAAPAELPDEPYRSLAYYDEKDRALFTGRDADVVRFAATLDRPDTRILILHGESGTGKSSFLRAGVIPYLEEECVGYRFFRRGDGAVLIVQAAKDLVGQLAQALLDATAKPLNFTTPVGEPLAVDLRRSLDEALGKKANYATLRKTLRRDVHLLVDILTRMAGRLPHALVLVLDQAEEIFTLARTAEEIASRDHGLRMLQRLVDVSADVKLIVSLRTEYYGRLLDHLRAGRRDLTGVRDDLLRDFSKAALIEAITRPTSETPLVPGQTSPCKKYGFRYAEGVPGQIADGVLALRSENQDSVLPLVQVICTQLYEREATRPGMDGVITREDLDAIKGVEGGLKAFAEDALVRSMGLGPADREAFKALFSQLYNRQPDGTLTTWMMPRESLEGRWDRPTPFADLLKAATSVRLLREDEMRIEGGEPSRYVRLGHDALAKVAAAWQAEHEEKQRLEQERGRRRKQFRRLLIGSLVTGCLAFLFALGGLFVSGKNWELGEANKALAIITGQSKREAENARAAEQKARREAENARVAEQKARREAENARAAEQKAKRQERLAQLRQMSSTFSRVNQLWQTEPEKGLALLLDPVNFPSPEDRDFTWGYYHRLCDRVRKFLGHEDEVLSVTFSPDGRTLASAGSDGTIRLWDAATRLARATLKGHKGPVNSVAISPNGHILASAGVDRSVRLWDTATGEAMTVLEGHEAVVRTVSFSPDGRTLASASFDGTIRLWDTAAGEARATLKGHVGVVYSVCFSSDGRTLASAGYDVIVRVWDVSTGRVRDTLKGHENTVISVAFSPDGRTLASAGIDRTIRLWDAATGEARATLKGHENSVQSVAFSPDGRTMASAGIDRTIRLWDVATGEARATLKGHEGPVHSVAFAPDGRTLASAGADRAVRLWDAATGEAKIALEGQKAPVRSVCFSPDGHTLASAGADGAIRLWDAVTGLARATLKGHEGSVYSVAFAPDGRILASAGADRAVRLWDAATGEAKIALEGHKAPVRTICFSPDGRTLVSAGYDVIIRVWDASTGRARATLNGHEGSVITVAFSPDGRTLASAGSDGTIRLWDAATGKARSSPKGHGGEVHSVCFSPDGRTLASAGADGPIRLWDVVTGQARATLKGHDGSVDSLAFAPDSLTLASAGGDATIRLWDAAAGQSRAVLKGHEASATSVAFSPNGRTLASAGVDGAIGLWDPVTGETRAVLKGHEGSIYSMTFSPDGRTLASANDNWTIWLYDASAGETRAVLKGHEGSVYSVAFSPDGRTLASASGDRTVRLWDVATGQARAILKGHENTVTSVAYSPDGRTLASAGVDRTVRLWDAANGQARTTLKGHNGVVGSVCFSPDGRTLASAGADGPIRLWDVVTGLDRATLKGHEGAVWFVAFSPDGRTLASAGVDRTVRLWDAATGLPRATLKGHNDVVGSVCFSPDGRTLASASGDGVIRLWDAATGEARAALEGHDAAVRSICFSPDGLTLASASIEGTVWLRVAEFPEASRLRQGATKSK